MEPAFALQLIASAIPAVIGFLTIRSIKTVDATLAGLTAKVDALGAQDTMIRIELAKLEVRVMHLELALKIAGPK